MVKYKGYIAHVEFDDDLDMFSRRVINTRDVITFRGESIAELKQAFIDSVEDYISFCKEGDESPEKPYSGNFSIRLDPSLHQKISFISKKKE